MLWMSGAGAAPRTDARAGGELTKFAHPLRGQDSDYDALLERIGDARFVLLGEDTHGSLEHYRERVRITQRLIAEKGFRAVVVEGDWAPAQRVDRYVRGEGPDPDAERALAGFSAFPSWMWRNEPFRDLVSWLRERAEATSLPMGVYGMDTHGMRAAAAAVLDMLAEPEAKRVQGAYLCLARHDFDADRYAAQLKEDPEASCADEVASVYDALRRSAVFAGTEQRFLLLQNARIVRDAEAYARAQATPGTLAWNVRDTHMADTVDAVAEHLSRRYATPAKLVVWAHNLHIGDARATDRGAQDGYASLGQLLRERHADETVLVAFSTRKGTVRAAPMWGEPHRVFTIGAAARDSVPQVLAERVALPRFLIVFDEAQTIQEQLAPKLRHRAIGTVYWPHAEQREHYYDGYLTRQFDAVIHIDRTRALPALPVKLEPD
jgi:erythromycin esterase-like protein